MRYFVLRADSKTFEDAIKKSIESINSLGLIDNMILSRKVDKLLEQKNYMEPDEHSPESVIGDDNFKRVRFEDVNDQDETDLSFFNKCQ